MADTTRVITLSGGDKITVKRKSQEVLTRAAKIARNVKIRTGPQADLESGMAFTMLLTELLIEKWEKSDGVEVKEKDYRPILDDHSALVDAINRIADDLEDKYNKGDTEVVEGF